MPPFQYQPFVAPDIPSIAALIARSADPYAQAATNIAAGNARASDAIAAAQARAAEMRGDIWGRTLGQIGQIAANLPGQIQQSRNAQQETQLRGIQIDEAQRQLAAQKQMDDAFAGAYTPDANGQPQLDEGKLLSHLPGHLVPGVLQNLTAIKKASADLQESMGKVQQQRTDLAAGLLNGVKAGGYDPKLFLAAVKTASGYGLIPPEEAQQHAIGAIEQGAPYVQQVTDAYLARSPEWQKVQNEATTANARASQAQTAADRLKAELPNIGLQTQKLQQQVSGTEPIQPAQQATIDQGAQRIAIAKQELALNLRKQGFDESQGLNADDPKAQAAIDMLGTYMATTGQMPQGFRVYGKNSAGFYTAVAANAAEKVKAGGGNLATTAAGYKADQASLTQQQKMFDAAQAFLSTADRNAALLDESIKKIPDTGSPVFNKPLRSFAANVSGNADLSQFATYLTSVQNEYAKILTNPNLAGQLTDSARHEAQMLVSPDATVPQILASLKALRAEGTNRLRSIGDQIGAIKGRIGGNAGTGGSVKMQAPDGSTRDVPTDQVEHYKALGARVIGG